MNIPLIRICLVTALCCCASISKAQDSITARELDEIVVTEERGWIEGNVVNYLPTRKEKRLSDNPATLIKAMHLPMLRVKEGTIETLNGAPVVASSTASGRTTSTSRHSGRKM